MAYNYRTRNIGENRFYRAWRAMHRRCYNPSTQHYERWGGRGIKVCERWHHFDNFYDDMFSSYKDSLNLDRINNDGNYEPSNVRWATPKEQAINRSSNKYVTHAGQRKTVAEWAAIAQCKNSTFRQRLYVLKCDMGKCLAPPMRKRG